jgi:hypothetical protein
MCATSLEIGNLDALMLMVVDLRYGPNGKRKEERAWLITATMQVLKF